MRGHGTTGEMSDVLSGRGRGVRNRSGLGDGFALIASDILITDVQKKNGRRACCVQKCFQPVHIHRRGKGKGMLISYYTMTTEFKSSVGMRPGWVLQYCIGHLTSGMRQDRMVSVSPLFH